MGGVTESQDGKAGMGDREWEIGKGGLVLYLSVDEAFGFVNMDRERGG